MRGIGLSKSGFTLIEALTVISVIGILAALTTYGVSEAQRQARDAKRKSDITAIAVAFGARYEYKLCGAENRSRYPGWVGFDTTDSRVWSPVKELLNYTDDCGAFTEFLSTVPSDPRYEAVYPYTYDLSELPSIGKHFRLAARLERRTIQSDRDEYCRLSRIWVATFQGRPYSGCSNTGFAPKSLFARTQNKDDQQSGNDGINLPPPDNGDGDDDNNKNIDQPGDGGTIITPPGDEDSFYNYFVGN